jgi:PAS domain S-box-containing protein
MEASTLKCFIHFHNQSHEINDMANARNLNHSRFWQRIQGKLILLLLILFLPFLLIQAYAFHERFETRRTEELQSNLELARAAGQAFEAFVKDIIHQELSIGLALTSSQSLTEEDQNRILIGSKRGNSAIWEIFWSRPDGIVIAATGPQFIGISFADRDYFREIVSGREWTVSDLILSRTTGRPSFTISRGIRSDTGQLLGIVVAGILPEQLDHTLAIKRSKGGGHALVDRKGMLVYRHPAINYPDWEQRNWLKDYPEFGVALNGNEISKTVFAPFEGKNRLVSFAPVSLIGWAASAGRTEEIAMEAITSQLMPQAVLFLLVTLAAFGVALILSRFISMPVKRLRDHALVLGRGETDAPAAAAGPAELRELADSFNRMAEQLRSRETSLRDQREWLRITLNSIGDAVLTTDTEGRVTLLNPVASDLTGWKLEEALGQPVQNIFHIINEKTREPAENIVDRVLREGRGIDLANHTALLRSDGREVPIEDSAAPIRDGAGKVSGVVLVFHDVTERRLMLDSLHKSEEHLKTSLAEKEILLKEIHHRVKNNMQVISSLVSLQAGGSKDETVRDVLRDVEYRVRAMALVHEKLYQSDNLARIDFSEYIRSLLNSLWKAHGEIAASVRMTSDLEPVLLPVDTAIPCGLILNELASNALKHAFKGRSDGEVLVSLRKTAEGGFSLRVRDNGRGLPEGFDWSQAQSLGLRLVQMLAGQLHAAVEVSNNEGTEFSVTIS